MLDTSVRLLRLLALLPTRPTWSGPELAERLGVTTRTVRSDVERLRILGYEVRSAPGVAGGYRLGSGTALPPLLLDDEEATVVTVALRAAVAGSVTGAEDAALRALGKLDTVLPSRLRARADALRAAVASAPEAGSGVDAGVLAEIATAVASRTGLRLEYRAHDGTTTSRAVEPYRLVRVGRRWYLLAFDLDRDDWRTFRVDRLRLRTPGGRRFVPRPVPGGDAVAHVVRGVGSVAWAYPARVRLHAPASAVADRLAPGSGVLVDDGPDACVLEAGGTSLVQLAGFLLGLDVDLTVLAPPELAATLARVGDRAARAGRSRGASGAGVERAPDGGVG
ncbi:helix-turn-helix transcriptional regulator [Cellulosimicrobium protaetiae]|uniref:WYL domain-containing protein n=1 Tax=Cellulosimicrobium protaetiae TaxID=2587808 RepID=A0A6M5UH16_9MICO|nr:WYL domain-containing protein [Cellulosimicrobium protaetiae]QJW35939.1 WYL domain-containing protein [Cellulosimicrobium protaetiae]